MSRSNRQACVALAFTIIAGAGGCSKKPAEPTAVEPLVMAPSTGTPPPAAQRRENTVEAELNAAGVAASYRATFEGERLTRIAETRRGASATADYEFVGGRLMRYQGPGLTTTATLDLEFDIKGAPVGAAKTPAQELDAIRARADILRSHALARNASMQHGH